MNLFKKKLNFEKNKFFIFLPNLLELVPIHLLSILALNDLIGIDTQKNKIIYNTSKFIFGRKCNNILLWGAKGMGKSTLIKSVVKHFEKHNLTYIEIFPNSIHYIPEIVYYLSAFNQKFIIYIDDLNLKSDDKNFTMFKTIIEGSCLTDLNNIKFYVSSNLRHIAHKNHKNNSDFSNINSTEASENLLALSDRFGLWVGFHKINKNQYLKIIEHYLRKNSINISPEIMNAAVRWSVEKGSYSGRTAWQFVNDLSPDD